MRANNSYIYREGTTPNTKAAISSKVKVFSYAARQQGWTQIGVMSSFAPSQSRAADPARGVGYGDQIAELIPGVMDPVTISVERTALYLANLFQVLGYYGGADGLVRALKHNRWPFDVRQEMLISELELEEIQESGFTDNDFLSSVKEQKGPLETAAKLKALLTIYEGCWMTSYDYTVSSDTAMISESTSISCTDIVDGSSLYYEFINSGLGVGAQNASRLFMTGEGVTQTLRAIDSTGRGAGSSL